MIIEFIKQFDDFHWLPVTVINESSDQWRTLHCTDINIVANDIEKHYFKTAYSLEWWMCTTK